MKINLLKAVVLENKKRGVVALLSLVCLILFALTPGAAQLKNQKLITALQLGDTPEGARVTIVSDSALSDYEAFRRGDRFYVKIPLADFTSPLPHFRADGFEDVQVERVGDGVIVSFKLQPGAAAHVEQRCNQLDVIFSAPNRGFRNNTANVGANRVTTGANSSQTAPLHAGPKPTDTWPAFRQSRGSQSSRTQTNRPTDSNKSGNNPSTTNNAAVNSPAAASSPTSALSPLTASSYPALTTATPAAPVSSNPAAGTSGLSSSPGFLDWRTRGKAAVQWISANRLATLLGALILLSLILYLAMTLRRRRKNVAKAKRVKAPKVQPTHSPDADLFEVSDTAAVVPAASSNQPRDFVSEPSLASSGAAASSQSHAWVLTKPAIGLPTAGPSEAGSEEQEREVFEL